jgi:hypothetical protein
MLFVGGSLTISLLKLGVFQPAETAFINKVGDQNQQNSKHPQSNELSSTYISSPIDTVRDDDEILQEFFTWRINSCTNEKRRSKWQAAQVIVDENDWSIQDLKRMEDDTSQIFIRATNAGLSDGIARAFRAELKKFKPVYKQRKEEEVARILAGAARGFL